MKVLDQIKKYVGAVESLYKIITIVSAAGVTAASALAIGSKTLQYVLVGSALAGLVLAFFFTIPVYAGKGRERNIRVRNRYIFLACAGFFFAVFVYAMTNPAVATYSSSLEGLRELLLSNMLLFNVAIAVGAFATIYFLAGAIILSAPGLWRAQL